MEEHQRPEHFQVNSIAVTEPDIDELFRQTLQGEYDDDPPWDAVSQLRRLGTREVFDHAARWCRSADPLRRARGADVLSQLGKTADHPTNNFPEDCYAEVSDLVGCETDPRPLGSAIAALGHIGDGRAVSLIALHKSHSDETVRLDVAVALGNFPNDPLSVATLLALTSDEDEDVRDWAVFGIGVLGDAESVEIRDALAACLQDASEEVREEAMVGLAKRKEQRVLPALRLALELKGTYVRPRDAASLMLGMESDREEWSAAEYLSALKEDFAD